MTTNKEEKEKEVERQKGVDDLLVEVASSKEFASDKEIKEEKDKDEKDTDKDKDKDKDKKKDKKKKKDDEDEEEEEQEDEDDDDDADSKDEDEDEEEEESKEEDEDEDKEKSDDDEDDDEEDEEDEDKVGSLEKEISTLRETLKEMTSPKEKKKKDEDEDEDEEDEDEDKEKSKLERKGKDYVFVTQEELDGEGFEIDADYLNKFANKIANQVKKDSLTSTAKIVKSHIDETQRLRGLSDSFYKKNPDLDKDDLKSFVGYRVNVLLNEHPDWSYSKLFSELGKDVRSKLGLKGKAKEIEKERKKKPAFVKKQKSKSKPKEKKKGKVSSQQEQVDELMPE